MDQNTTISLPDPETGLGTLAQFKTNTAKYAYNKICMISVEKGILISGRRGEEAWKHLYQKNIQQIKHRIQDDAIHFYCHDNWSFFFTAGADYADDLFLAKARDAFLHCGCYYSSMQNLTAVNVFHVVMGESDLLEKAQISMSAHGQENGRFFIYNKGDSSALMEQMDHRLFMTNVINDAIVYDRIVPYFQPIRDNRTKKICKYEALMRLSDKECNIYSPGQFLEISKNYHLYLQLSQQMIRKVLGLFRNRTETVFLNLSAYDIYAKSNRDFIFALIRDLPPETCQRITFEILETEQIQDYEELMRFLQEIRKFGVKIAIDDFGSGYSNLSAILKISPDFIKIDGDLIIDCDKDPKKRVCLQAISDIAKEIHAELIAEHVERSGEQETVESANIEYTQGYYFSKPVPYPYLKKE